MALIYYHVDWPGADVMNANNASEVTTAVNLYGVGSTGVPYSVLDGVGLSSTVTQTNINTDYAVSAPFTINMTHQVTNGVISVRMVVKKTATVTGTFAAKIAVIETLMTFTSPAAGTNGETSFLNVFKKYLPDANGTTLPTMNVGDSVVITKSWTYSNVQTVANLKAVGYVQNTSDKTVPQAAYSVAGTVPPTADFTTATATSCTGQISFSDLSTPATAWSWDFGDGGTSALQNPTHTYTANGNYTVSLTITQSGVNNKATKTNFVAINMPAAPTTTDGSGSVGSQVTLHATGTGTDSLKWYTTQTGGTPINIGNTFTTPALSSTTHYYVEEVVPQAVQSVGIASSTLSTSTGGYYTAAARPGLLFDALSPFTLKSVMVYEKTAGSRTIWLQKSDGTYLDSLVTTVSAGQQTVTLNFPVPAGTGYTIGVGASCYFWRASSGAAYPYTLSNLVSITSSTAGSAYYYFFYNWQVQGNSCISPRAEVTADILTGINEKYSTISYNLFPNPTLGEVTLYINSLQEQNITVDIVDMNGKIVYSDQLNLNGELNKRYDLTGFSKGVYFMRLITNKEVHNEKIIVE